MILGRVDVQMCGARSGQLLNLMFAFEIGLGFFYTADTKQQYYKSTTKLIVLLNFTCSK